jgi:predicted aminopeptidase
MPQFILDTGTPEAAHTYSKLDTFTRAYIEAMFFTDANSDSEELADASFAELAPETLQSIIKDCTDFQTSFAELIERACALGWMTYDEASAGHDFWFTRNGHGTGFWDRGLGDVGNELTEMSKPYGEVSLYRGDDGLIYLA